MEIQPIPKKLKHRRMHRSRRWQALSKSFRASKVLWGEWYQCAICKGHFKEVDVDHILKRSVRPDLIYVESNLQILCRPCHIKKDT